MIGLIKVFYSILFYSSMRNANVIYHFKAEVFSFKAM